MQFLEKTAAGYEVLRCTQDDMLGALNWGSFVALRMTAAAFNKSRIALAAQPPVLSYLHRAGVVILNEVKDLIVVILNEVKDLIVVILNEVKDLRANDPEVKDPAGLLC